MPKYKQTNATSKSGVNFVRTVVEAGNCIFHKIEQENDLGIDGLIELIRDEAPLNKQFAVQVKAGESYFIPKTRECLIPIDGHREYWAAYPLPVIGVVFVPSLTAAYWVDIKGYLKRFPKDNVIRFRCTRVNAFDKTAFQSFFMPMNLKEIPDIPYEQAKVLFESGNFEELRVGLVVLFRKFPNRVEIWDRFIDFFKRTPAERIPASLIYYLAHVPWHGDIFAFGEQLTEATRDYVRSTHLHNFGPDEVVKLLSLIDEENMISRGTIGQSVEAIVSSLPTSSQILANVLADKTHPRFIRELAALILAMQEPKVALLHLIELNKEGSWYMGEVAAHVQQWGRINLYG